MRDWVISATGPPCGEPFAVRLLNITDADDESWGCALAVALAQASRAGMLLWGCTRACTAHACVNGVTRCEGPGDHKLLHHTAMADNEHEHEHGHGGHGGHDHGGLPDLEVAKQAFAAGG